MYERFLNNDDYLSIVTEEALQQLIRGRESRLAQAEEAAEASIVEYLTDNYEVEKELQKGKSLRQYNKKIVYPVGSHFYYDGQIFEAMRSISGVKVPSDRIYWEEILEYNDEIAKSAVPYSQLKNWAPGNIVTFSNTFFRCTEFNGIDYDDIRIPGTCGWERVEVYEWKANLPYNLWEVVKYEDKFYALVTNEGLDLTVNPFESENWGLIGTYDPDYPYLFSNTEYVEFEGEVYYPTMAVTASELKEGYNIRLHDPRNSNLKKHLLRLAVYELHKLISPNNISSARITDYEASIMWLRDANRCRINPGIPRKVDESGKHVTEFAIATFMRNYDPNENPWQI